MPTSARVILTSLLVCLSACGGGGGSDRSAPQPPTGFTATSIESALGYAIDQGVDGIWLYVDDGNGTPATTAAGIQDKTSLEPADSAALFKIASISKLFIAASSVKLVDEGVLRLDDTLGFWLPSVATRIANGNTITVRQLLQHRSGVRDFDSEPGFDWGDPHADLDALLQLVFDKPADFAPGARYEYSNTNYLLLGMILDAALGYGHHDFVQSEILTPSGMLDTYSLLSDVSTSLLAHGYWNGADRTTQVYVVPGGSMISSVRDTGVFLRELATGDLLDNGERALFLDLFGGYAHSGWLPGYQSIARYDAQSDTVIVQFINNTGGQSEEVATTVFDALLDYVRSN